MRGDLVSRPIGEVMNEAENLLKAGVQELLVISQDTSAYGVDVRYRTGFWRGRPLKTRMTDLAAALGDSPPSTAPGCACITSIRTRTSTRSSVDGSEGGAVLPYLDVPFQHASPRILKLMKRPANAENNLERIRAWREVCPELTIRSTFIVGLPGRDRGRIRGSCSNSSRRPARPRRLLRLFAGRRRGRQRAARSACRKR